MISKIENIIPKVSVVVGTYNHKDYISKCLDSILMQQTTFPFEIILGEDESRDGTRDICKEYALKNPEKIRLFLRNRKDVIYINGNPTGRYNFIENLKAATGEYIALCDGDDYWTDPLKLQKQVDFMEEKPNYTICFHKVKNLANKNFEEDEVINNRYNNIKNRPITVTDLVEQSNFIHTPSVLFRNVLTEFPLEFSYSSVGDYFLYILLSQKGFIHRIDEEMAVYRRNVGIYSTLSSFEMKKRILIYQSCILSYLDDPVLKEKLLQKQIRTIDDLKLKQSINLNNIHLYYQVITWRNAFKLSILKFKYLFK